MLEILRGGRLLESISIDRLFDTNSIMSLSIYKYMLEILRGGRLLESMTIDRLFDTNSIMSNMLL